MLEAQIIIVVVLGSFIAATISSVLGFGIGLAAGPILLIVLDPTTTVILLNTIGTGIALLIVIQTKDRLNSKEMFQISAAGLIGMPVGLYLLGLYSVEAGRIVILGLVILLSLILSVDRWISLNIPKQLGPPLAFIVSALVVSSAIGGPLIALYLMNRKRDVIEIRAGLAVFFLIVMGSSVAGYAISGLFTKDLMLLIGLSAIPVCIGFKTGVFLLRRIDYQRFRRVALILIIVSSIFLIIIERVQA